MRITQPYPERLLLLQHLGRVGAGGADGMEKDSGSGNEHQDDCFNSFIGLEFISRTACQVMEAMATEATRITAKR